MSTGQGPITRSDIEAKLRNLRDSLEPVGEEAKGSVMRFAPLAVAALVVLAYVAGRRKGRKGRPVIEIRRV